MLTPPPPPPRPLSIHALARKRPRPARRLALGLLAASILGGCAVTEPLVRPDIALPAAWSEPSASAASSIADTWWQGFGSPQLDALVAQAMLSAPDLRIQAERVVQAELALRQAGASLLPSLALGGGSGVQNAEGDESASTSASLNARYEIDLWGRLAATRDASRAGLAATRFDHDAARLSMAANVATLWFQSLTLAERIDIARQNLAIAERVLRVVQARYDNGAASALDLSQQRSTVLAQRKAIEPLEVSLRQTRSALAILLGHPPQTGVTASERLAELQVPVIDAGLPSELLLRRPDIAASEAGLAAAAANLAAARAALLPAISLAAGAATSSAELLALAGRNSVLSLSASLLQTIFDGGRLAADVDIQRSHQRELVEAHRQTVLTALKEVEDALANTARDARQESAQREILAEARRSLRLSELRYREGADGLLAVLDAQRALFAAQDQLVQLRLARLSGAVDLYRALGGGWQAGQDGPTAMAPPAGASRTE